MPTAFGDPAATHEVELGALAALHRRSGGAATGGLLHRVHGEPEAVLDAIAALAARHEALRSRRRDDRLEVLDPAELEAGLRPLLVAHDLRAVAAEQLDEAITAIARGLQEGGFAGGLPWRCAVVVEAESAARLVWAFDHAVLDAASAATIRGELEQLVAGVEPAPARPLGEFLAALDGDVDWPAELEALDAERWLDANRRLGERAAGLAGRRSAPLDGGDPLAIALRLVHELLAPLVDGDAVPIGIVSDCRSWRGERFGSCIGELLDVVPATLRGEGDREAIAERLAGLRERGAHLVTALAGPPADDPVVAALQRAYADERGRLDLVLVNFQGELAADEIPAGERPAGAAIARHHINAWHDAESVRIEFVVEEDAR